MMNEERNETNDSARLTQTLDRVNCGLVAAIVLTLLLPLLRVLAL